MREETSVLFEQIRDFGGSVIISSQGYAGLGPREYADRILDACSTYVLHACSDPFEVSKRAGKHWKLDTSYTEDEEGYPRPHHRPHYDWRVPETAVMQQEEGQAFWIYKGRAQQVQTAQVQMSGEQVREAWGEIRRQEEIQRSLLEQQTQKRKSQAHPPKTPQPPPAAQTTPSDPRLAGNGTAGKSKKRAPQSKPAPVSPQANSPEPKASMPEPPQRPLPSGLDDDEPDEL